MAASGAFDPGGPVAREMASLMWVLVGLGTLVLTIFLALLIRGLVRSPVQPASEESIWRRWLVGAGVVMPAAVIAVVLGLTLMAMRSTQLPDGSMTVQVVGHQWWWEVRYDGFVTANEIHIPVGEPVVFELVSRDVIHSFWVPELGGKIDLLPDTTNTVVLQADRPGEYGGVCAEFCGLQHARMRLRVVAESPEDHEQWAAAQRQQAVPAEDPAAVRGQEVFYAEDCGRCHRIRGTTAKGEVAPDLTHLASRATLAAGTIANTPDNLAAWITDPAEIKEGAAMPAAQLSAEDLEALVTYLGTLR